MGLWRKFVTVIAGTMIAAGGIVGTLAVLEAVAPAPGAPQPASSPWLFDAQTAEVAVVSDFDVVSTWLNDTAVAGGAVAPEDARDAAVAASAFSDVSTAADRATAEGGLAFEPSSIDYTAGGAQAVQDAGTIVLAYGADGVVADPQTDAELAAQADAAFLFASTAGSLEALGQPDGADRVVQLGAPVVHTPLANASAAVAAASTTIVARLATVPNAVPAHGNWTLAAAAEIAGRADAGTLDQDTVSLALASQALSGTRPADAAAINAELRSRQGTDGSFGGDLAATAESVRALGPSPYGYDRYSAALGLDWLDSQGQLAPPDAALRLRAHAVDGKLAADAYGGGVPEASAMSGASIVGSKGVLAFLFLAGGIGLSLTLVTNDALKGVRRRLYDTIRAEPGLHVNELRRRLSMSPSSIEYHLSVLVGAGLAVSEDDGRYKRFYANGAGLGLNPRSPNSRNALGALRRPHASEIMQHLLDRDDATAREVSRALSLHESAASRRLDHLERAGLLVSDRVGRERRYRVRERQAAIRAISMVDGAAPPAQPSEDVRDASSERSPSEGAAALSP